MSFHVDLWDGLDVVFEHMTRVKDAGKELIEIFEERVKIEQRYAKDLISLNKKSLSGDDMNTLRESIGQVKMENEGMGNAHNDLANLIQIVCVQGVTSWRDGYKKMFHQMKDDVERITKVYNSLQNAHKKAMQNYMVKCKTADKAHQEWSSNTIAEKKLKLWPVYEQAERAALQADEEYRAAIRAVQAGRIEFDRSVEGILKQMEASEKFRNLTFHDILHKLSEGVVSCGERTASVGKAFAAVIGKMDSHADIVAFVTTRTSGKSQPPQVEYEPVQWVGAEKQGGDMLKGPAAAAAAVPSAGPSPTPSARTSTQSATPVSAPISAPVTPQAIPAPAASAVSRTSKRSERYYALYQYDANEGNELSFQAGDVVLVVSKDGSGWWTGHLEGHTEEGVFPASFVGTHAEYQAALDAAAAEESAAGGEETGEYVVLRQVKAVYDFETSDEGAMKLVAGEVLDQLTEENEGWIFCRNSSGVEGNVPAAYVGPL